MVALLAGVLVAIAIARRPETWSVFTSESSEHPAATAPVSDGGSPAVDVFTERQTPAPNRLVESLKIGAIIVLAVAYLSWRASRLMRRRTKAEPEPPPAGSG